MSSESIPANEYPDRVGFKPDNPYLATFRPYIPAGVRLRELTILPLIVGTVLGIIFGASSLYLVLKVGLTVSASIPVAVISITLFRVLSKMGLRDATILENNIVQTAGSAGESIAFGLGVTMPAILILGFDLELSRVMLVAVLGGLLGILMMIPLRRALIVAQHGYLKYPEGTACAEVLKAGASDESRAAAAHSPVLRLVWDEPDGGLGSPVSRQGCRIGTSALAHHALAPRRPVRRSLAWLPARLAPGPRHRLVPASDPAGTERSGYEVCAGEGSVRVVTFNAER